MVSQRGQQCLDDSFHTLYAELGCPEGASLILIFQGLTLDSRLQPLPYLTLMLTLEMNLSHHGTGTSRLLVGFSCNSTDQE